MIYPYKSIKCCERAIKRLKSRIELNESLKSSADGVFWRDVKRLDEGIDLLKGDLVLLENHLVKLKGLYPEKLINELRASEIF